MLLICHVRWSQFRVPLICDVLPDITLSHMCFVFKSSALYVKNCNKIKGLRVFGIKREPILNKFYALEMPNACVRFQVQFNPEVGGIIFR